MDNLLKNNSLFKECLEALNGSLLPNEEAKEILELFEKTFPITNWYKINWDKIDKKIEVGYEPEDIISELTKLLN
jgi:hypothetical protein